MKTFEYAGDLDALAKRMMYLAWKSSSCLGMGLFQDKGHQEEDQVWQSMMLKSDYGGFNNRNKQGNVYADYVNGRMMKTGIRWGDGKISVTDDLRSDYQSWCRTYRTADDLFSAAVKSLEKANV